MRKTLLLLTLLLLFIPLALAAPPPEIDIWRTDDKTLLLSFAGDCTLGSEGTLQNGKYQFVPVIAEKGFDWPFSGTKAIFEQDDLTLVNLESSFTEAKREMDKKYCFRAPMTYADILPLGSVEAVNRANNHSMDYYQAGYDSTSQALDRRGIAHFDDGRPALMTIKGVDIALLGLCAPRDKDITDLAAQIGALREQGADLVVVSLHWGYEYYTRQNDQQVKWAQKLVDGGADIIIGTHPHVLQGMELYKGRPIIYSLGNFSFGGNRDPRDWDTMIVQVSFDIAQGKPVFETLRIIPCLVSDSQERFQDFRPVPVVGEQAQKILKKAGRYSEGFDESLFVDGIHVFQTANP